MPTKFTSPMPLIDAHQHYWDPARGDYFWLTPDLAALYRRFGPADLAPLLAEHGVAGTILVQAAPTIAETDYMLAIADATPSVLGVVGWVDFEDASHLAHLERFARHPKFKGLRPMIQDIADPDWMLRRDLDWAFEAMIGHDLAFDALTHPKHLPNLLALLKRHEGLRCVIDHASKPAVSRGEFEPWASDMARLAGETQAFVKFSGLVTEAGAGWRIDDLAPFATHLLAKFGPQRMIFGSDWPVCKLAASYGAWFETARELTAHLGEACRADIFGGVAARAYRLQPHIPLA